MTRGRRAGATDAPAPLRIRAGRHVVAISHPEKVLFPRDGLTKADLAGYYAEVAPTMMPHVKGRPLVLNRYRDGIGRPGFVQQDLGDAGPGWVERVETPRRRGGSIRHPVSANRETFVWLANQNAITLHAWTSRAPKLDRPDRLIIDLDPPDDFDQARAAAVNVRELLDELGLRAMPMTTGSRGLHIIVPLRPERSHDTVRAFAHDVAEVLAARHPATLTAAQRIANRDGRLYLDMARNTYGQTSVAPYSVRPRDGAPVATPLVWEELDDPALRADTFTLRTIPDRLAAGGDRWAGIDRHRQSLRRPAERLARMRRGIMA
jgi:bifunctional non-homologous end joining protein LigD